MQTLSRRDLLASLFVLPMSSYAGSSAQADGWIPLFDGKSLDGWKASGQPGSFKAIDGQIAAVRTYADHYRTLSDADAQAYIDALLERDQQIHDLRRQYLAKYAKVIGARRAARVIHLSRKLGIASQARLAEVIPLVR